MKSSRNTTAKKEIHDLIIASEFALSHADIQKSLDGLCDRVTVYRVLDRLLEEGSIHKIINVDGVVKYANCNACAGKHKHHHIHFSCEKCKSLTCLHGVEPVYKLPRKYKVTDMNFTLTGVCPNCS